MQGLKLSSKVLNYFILGILACLASVPGSVSASDLETSADKCARIVSLAPSITESLYFLGLDENIIAVSEYDKYPKEVLKKPKVGALFGTNLEALFKFQPSTIFLLAEQEETKRQIDKLALASLVVDHRSIAGILSGLEAIAAYCDLKVQNTNIIKLKKKYYKWLDKAKKPAKPKVLILLAAPATDGISQTAYVLGRDGFYQDLISAAGGQSAYQGMTKLLPDVSMEGILSIQPDVIFILAENNSENHLNSQQHLTKQIKKLLPNVIAVKNNKIFVLNEDYLLIPGPRFIKIIQKFHALLLK